MDIALIIAGAICVLTGIVGCIAPVLPGPPLTWAGLLLLKLTSIYGDKMSWTWIIIWAVVSIVTLVLDYLIPIWGTKKMGGSKEGVWGATIGMFIGLLFLPWGIVVAPFFGALIGESIIGNNRSKSLKAAFGSFMGFVLSIGLKLLASGLMAGYFVITLFQ